MPKVSIKKTESAVPKKAEKKTEDKREAAVSINEKFEAKRAELNEARDARDEAIDQHPEVKELVENAKVIEDECHELLKEAKVIMGASGEKEIGEFKMQYPMSTPTYDGKRLLKLLMKLKDDSTKGKADRFDIIVDLYERGLIVGIEVDSKVAELVKDRPAMKFIDSAWEPSTAMTPRVTVPKI